jgi:P27 family predicted phage terminase small subunit
MTRGRKPTPTYLKLLKGNPGKRALNKNEPQPLKSAEVPKPPDYLDGCGAQEWRRIAPELYRMGLLTLVDIPILALYCHAYSTWRTASEALAQAAERDPVFKGLVIKTNRGTPVQNPIWLAARQAANDMLRIAAEFGCTPAARSRINNPLPPQGPSKFDGLIGGWDGRPPA